MKSTCVYSTHMNNITHTATTLTKLILFYFDSHLFATLMWPKTTQLVCWQLSYDPKSYVVCFIFFWNVIQDRDIKHLKVITAQYQTTNINNNFSAKFWMPMLIKLILRFPCFLVVIVVSTWIRRYMTFYYWVIVWFFQCPSTFFFLCVCGLWFFPFSQWICRAFLQTVNIVPKT